MPTRVELVSVEVASPNPAPFDSPFALRVVFQVLEDPPKSPIDVLFVWSPIWDFPVDQELDELEVGPFSTLGRHECLLECDPPNLAEIPDPTGQTALMISFRYRGSEFLHIGYNVGVTSSLLETPDVYTDASVLTRKFGRSFRKLTEIAWDEDKAAFERNGVLQVLSTTNVSGPAAAAAAGGHSASPSSNSGDDDEVDSNSESSDECPEGYNSDHELNVSSEPPLARSNTATTNPVVESKGNGTECNEGRKRARDS